jgi:hypothetical protein
VRVTRDVLHRSAKTGLEQRLRGSLLADRF